MKTNESLQIDVQDAIKWEPLLHAAEIGVAVKDGVVTLTGTVDNYIKKTEAEIAARNVKGVKAVVEKIEIKYNNSWDIKSDLDIANEVISALRWNWNVPNDTVKVKVEGGWVTLDGDLTWNYQREAARNAIQNLEGVKGIYNNIKIKSDNTDTIEKAAIEKALSRNWSINDNDIEVDVKANEVTLTGAVTSYYQKDEAERIAWKAPGVSAVNNELTVGYYE
ncbi:BON domain-containing protein [Flavobacterium restrictum]|uniref:BON domain-containing protein n=1 Tax=Flavobacterium restrictum TaxID=2594428 RepID=A0A553EDV2_9FLAO|nr:BON domain-containing protein [Flavobacterium restrictum]TRX43131.1 BON domain-containing protein [Flavobacterium restrictum]